MLNRDPGVTNNPPSTSYRIANQRISHHQPPQSLPPTQQQQLVLDNTISRRTQLATLTAATSLLWPPSSTLFPNSITAAAATATDLQRQPSIPNYAQDGPCTGIKLPTVLEHYCTVCKTAADKCRVRIQAYYPKGGARAGLQPRFPLAIITSGFLIGSDQYSSYAQRLASWGYCVLTYDVTQQALDPITDTVSVDLLRDLIDWARVAQPLSNITDTENVLLIGHSRGAKITTLAATADARVRSIFLLDPVDVTVYAPLAPEYPSAVASLQNLAASLEQQQQKQQQQKKAVKQQDTKASLPIAIVGSALGSDCAPSDSNYKIYYEAAPGAAFEAVLQDAGHLQFLDARGGNIMDAVCLAGKVSDQGVREISMALLVAWAEATIRDSPTFETGISGNTVEDDAIVRGRRFGVLPDGKIVAGPFPTIDALTRLYSAVQAGNEKLGGLGQSVRIETRAKNFAI